MIGWLRTITRRPFVVDALYLQSGQAATIALQAATSLILLRILGPELAGVYAIGTALAAAIALLDLTGANRLALVDVARAHGMRDADAIRGILARFIRVSVLVRLPMVVVFFAAGPAVARILYGDPIAGIWARWLALPLAVDIPFDLMIVLLQGRGRMSDLVRAETTRAIATAIGTIAVLVAGLGLAGVCLVQVAASGSAAAWGIAAYRSAAAREVVLPGWRDLLRSARTATARTRAIAGIAMAVEKNVGNLGGQLPMLIIGAVSPAQAGYYAAALRTMSLPYPLVSAFARQLEARLPHAAAGGRDAVRSAFARATIGAAAAWSVVTLGMTLIAPIVIMKLAGAEYAPAIPAVYPLVLQSLATGGGVAIGAGLRALDKPAHVLALQILSIAITAPIGLALIARGGAVGAAWFHALRYIVLTAVGVGWVFWLVRPAPASEEAALN